MNDQKPESSAQVRDSLRAEIKRLEKLLLHSRQLQDATKCALDGSLEENAASQAVVKEVRTLSEHIQKREDEQDLIDRLDQIVELTNHPSTALSSLLSKARAETWREAAKSVMDYVKGCEKGCDGQDVGCCANTPSTISSGFIFRAEELEAKAASSTGDG